MKDEEKIVCVVSNGDILMTTTQITSNFWAILCKTVRPMLSDRRPVLSAHCPVCLSVPSVCELVYCGQTVRRIKMKLGKWVGLCPGHIVLDGDPARPPPKRHSPQFSAHICRRKMAGWIKMPLGREADLCPSNIVLDEELRTQLPSKKRRRSPNFRSVSIVAKRLDGSRCHLVWR